MNAFKVLEPGAYTTVQDLGRYGYQEFGVPLSGVLDRFAARAANLLVGNPQDAAVLEMTFLGPRLEFLSPGLVAVCGAEMPLLLNGEPRPTWSAFAVRPGDVLVVKPAAAGLRGYLALSGGIAVPVVMNSRSTYVAARLGGLEGRALEKGDLLPLGEAGSLPPERELPAGLRPALEREIVLHALPGPQDDYFDQGLEVFFGSRFKVSAKADRMGYRLEGPRVELKQGVPRSIISEPSLPGAVQIPADAQPIVLLVEQTVGGYAKIATVVTPDLDRLAQARPGDGVRFARVEMEQAHRLAREYAERLQRLRTALA